MKIAIIAPTEIPARRANTLQVMKMAQAMAVLGHTVRMAVPIASRTKLAPKALAWEELAHHYGLKHAFGVEGLYSDPRLRRYDYSCRALRWANNWQAELIYTRLPQAAALSSQLGMTTILETHDLPQGNVGPWLFRRFLDGRGDSKLVIITQALAADLAQRFDLARRTLVTIIAADGVDLERYERLPSPGAARQKLAKLVSAAKQEAATSPLKRLASETFTVGYTGHLYPGRGREALLELAKRLPAVTFLVVGGEERDINEFQAQIEAQGAHNLLLAGFAPNAELPLYQAACDVLLMPYQHKVAASSGGDISRYLSPMKLFEYLACQRPIVSSDLPVLQEALNPNNAILVPPDNLEAWEQAIVNLQNDAALRNRLADQARQDAQRYTWEMRARLIFGETSFANETSSGETGFAE